MKRKTFAQFVQNALLVIVLLAMGIPAAHAQGNDIANLFNDASPSADMLVNDTPAHVLRSRYVSVDLGLLQNADAADQTFNFNLFDDANFVGTVENIEKPSADSVVWVGDLTNVDNGYFYLVTTDDVFMAHIASPEGVYEVSWAGSGVYRVVQIDQSQFVDHAPDAYDNVPVGDILPEGDIDPKADSADQIDIMVIYTDDARAAQGGTTAMKALISLAVTETNTSYSKAGVTTRLRLVHTAEVSYAETGNLNTDLTRFRGTSDGYMDNIHALRNTYGADMVGLLVNNGGDYCGLASAIMATATTAFQVTDKDCATGYYSFGHEFGHLQGARHDTYVDSNNTPYAYGHGYTYPTASWRTVMAYNNACTAVGKNCTRLDFWSNPSKTYLGVPTGISNTKNYLVLNNTDYTVANFRTAIATVTKPTPKLPAGTTTDRTPSFRWTPVPNATHYQLQVVKGTAIVYTRTYTYACVTATCARTPGTTLALAAHKFRVRAKVGGVWKPWSAYKYFKVIPASFYNNFNTTHPNWKPVTGSWAHLSGLYYSSVGVAGKWASIQQINDYKNGTFEAQLRRNGCVWCANSVMIRGVPTPVDATYSDWYKDYEFSYTNDGRFAIFERSGATETALKGWTASSAINSTTTATGKWNTLKVVFAGTTMKFYINGSLVATVTDASFKKGNLGIQLYRDSSSAGNRLYINYAKLSGGLADLNSMGEQILEGKPVFGGDSTGYLPNLK